MNPTESKIRDQYNQLALIYDQRWRRYISNTLTFLKNWAAISPSAVVLDIACGTGEFERLLLQDNSTQVITGVDLSERMLMQARRKLEGYPNLSFELARASDLPFSDHCFDVIITANAFHYFPDPDTALTEMRRVLKSAGKVVILDWCRDFWLCQICDWWLKRLDPAYRQCYTEAECHSLLKTVGFNICRAQRVRFDVIWGLMTMTATRT